MSNNIFSFLESCYLSQKTENMFENRFNSMLKIYVPDIQDIKFAIDNGWNNTAIKILEAPSLKKEEREKLVEIVASYYMKNNPHALTNSPSLVKKIHDSAAPSVKDLFVKQLKAVEEKMSLLQNSRLSSRAGVLPITTPHKNLQDSLNIIGVPSLKR